jgi:transcriptional regulator with XRE-family HTH domain
MRRRPRAKDEQWRKALVRLGARLRQLRKEAGLNQSELAVRFGSIGPGGKSYVSQIEHGRMPYLRLGAVLEYLRACRRSLDAILDITKEWTDQPTAADQSVRQALAELPFNERIRAGYYDIGMSERARKTGEPGYATDKRVSMALGQARALRRHEELNREFNRVLGGLHIGSRDRLAIPLKAFGRKLFAMLLRTRNSRPVWREKHLAALDHWAERHDLPPEPFRVLKSAVIALFDAMSHRSALD